MKRIPRIGRHLVIDARPLRKSRDLRCLFGGQLVIMLGGQLTTVAVPYQVYSLTRSTLDVGLVSLAQLLPLIAGGLVGGALADAVDRRSLLLASQLLTALGAVGLAVNAAVGTALWPLFVLPAVAAGCSVAGEAGLSAMLPNLAGRSDTATVNAMFQALLQVGQVAGPAVAGLLLAGVGVRFVYWLDAASVLVAALATARISRQRPAGTSHPPGLRSIVAGLSHLRGQPLIQGAYLIDINATVFGAPTAVFPALAFAVFHGGARTLGLLYAAPGAGALLGAVTTGWVHRVRRQGRAVIVAVIVWGIAIACFGLTHWLPLALALLAVAGLGRRHLRRLPRHDHPARRAGRTARAPDGPADGGGHGRTADRRRRVRRGRLRLRRHRVRRLGGPGLHRRRPDPGPPAPGVQPPGDAGRRRTGAHASRFLSASAQRPPPVRRGCRRNLSRTVAAGSRGSSAPPPVAGQPAGPSPRLRDARGPRRRLSRDPATTGCRRRRG